MKIITISREFGSGGRELGKRLADALGYEYTPGFVHAKVFVSDDREAVVGTINLDYRSLYHHFECATYLCGVDCIPEIEKDFGDTLGKCRQVTWETVKQEKLAVKATGHIMKAFAPLL